MIERKVVIKNKLGLHARPAALLVQITNKHVSEVHIARNSNKVNGKSIMSVLTLAAGHGSELVFFVEGQDEEIVMQKLVDLVESGFDEE